MTTDQYLQFGVPDYGGFTTEEEIARRLSTITGTRGSPSIGARVEAKRARVRAQEGAGLGMTNVAALQPIPMDADHSDVPKVSGQGQAQAQAQVQTRSVVSAFKNLCASRPESLIDWIIIFIIIVALVCMFENAPDMISRVFRGSAIGRAKGGWCAECGGVVD
ncbi:MAG: hypothetical protein WC919_07580 [Candidatus Paceibacterota bacterium]|jgi:hypothetical protein